MHRQMNKLFLSHPHIFSFLNSLKLFEFKKMKKLQSLHKSLPKHQLDRKKKECREREDKICHLTHLLVQKQIDVKAFLDGIVSAPKCGKHCEFRFGP